MNTPAKEWKSFDEQIDILQSRGMVIDDREQAKHFLRRVGYYRLSGYWYPFRQFSDDGTHRIDTYVENTKFSDIVKLYQFDRHLRLLALDAIERIELAVQVDIAHLLGKRDPYAHENPQQLHPNFSRRRHDNKPSQFEKWLEDYNRILQRSNRKACVEHNLNKYGRLPIWAAIEIFDFGTMSKLYAGMRHHDKIEIGKQFGLNQGTRFQTWLRGLNFIRNTAAHQSRLWNCNVVETASIPRNMIDLYKLSNTRPFLYFCIMQKILRIVSPQAQWTGKFIALIDDFPDIENNVVSIDDMGVVDGWKEWRLWA